jgi:Ca2+-binding RTX toxin-like protein
MNRSRTPSASLAQRALLALLLAPMLAAVPAPASGSSVELVKWDVEPVSKSLPTDVVAWTAAPGERNELTVTLTADTVLLRDPAAPIAAGRGCAALPGGMVSCRRGYLALTAGDGDDTLVVAAGQSITIAGVAAGEGDDSVRLVGPVGIGDVVTTGIAHELDGGAGDDLLALGDAAARADGGDGDDTIVGSRDADHLGGGAGDDEVTGGDGDDDLTGGEGADALDGGSGADELDAGDPLGQFFGFTDGAPNRLLGGPGRDRLASDGGDDAIDGGAGRDAVTYDARLRPVTVDLAAGRGGAARERDTLESVEDAEGGYNADTLIGDDGPNRLDGGPADASALPTHVQDSLVEDLGRGDVLRGGDGDDSLLGGVALERPGRLLGEGGGDLIAWNGASRVSGGPGDDRLRGTIDPRHSAAPLACDAGDDVVSAPNARDTIAADCEQIDVGGVVVRGRRFGLRALTLSAARAGGDYVRACGIAARLTGAGPARRPLAALVARTPRGSLHPLRLRAARPLGPRVRVVLRPADCPRRGAAAQPRADGPVSSFLLRR